MIENLDKIHDLFKASQFELAIQLIKGLGLELKDVLIELFDNYHIRKEHVTELLNKEVRILEYDHYKISYSYYSDLWYYRNRSNDNYSSNCTHRTKEKVFIKIAIHWLNKYK